MFKKRQTFVYKRQMYRMIEKAKKEVHTATNSNLNQNNFVNYSSEEQATENTSFINTIPQSIWQEFNVPESVLMEPILSFDTTSLCSNNSDHDDKSTSTEKRTLKSQLGHWAVTKHVPHTLVSDILHLLSPFHPELPLDARTLLHTPTKMVCKSLSNGELSFRSNSRSSTLDVSYCGVF